MTWRPGTTGNRARAKEARPGKARLIAYCMLALFMWGLAGAVGVSAQVPPDARYLTFDTENFQVTYMEGLETIARRAADRAERAYALLSAEFVAPPRGKIHLLMLDNVDVANGMASPFPRNRIIAFAQPPVSEPTLAFYQDWLDLLILHELVHIFHLDDARGIWPPLRRVFGREPFLFPQIFTPGWVLEGLGTYFESEYTGAGRVHGSMYEMVLRTAVLGDAFFAIDRATVDPVTWPGSTTRYVYGSLFINHLARLYGSDHVTAFIEELGGRLIPYRFDSAARDAFGTTLTRAWQAWEDSLRQDYSEVADSLRAAGLTEPEILSEEGRFAYFPRFSPDGSRIAYAAGTGREESALVLIEPDGSSTAVVPRSTLGPPAWSTDHDLLHGQLDFSGPHRVFSDLFVATVDGESRRLTDDARVWEPDPHPDGRRAVVVASARGTNVLALVDLQTGIVEPLTERDLDVHWSGPRWSPSGDRLAVGRWSPGGLFDVVLLDDEGALVEEITRDRAIDSSPAWSPDGRYLLFNSDRTGIANLYAYDILDRRLWQVTNVLTGAFQPDVSPDGRWIVFSYYDTDGYHIARIPFDPATWREAPPPAPERRETAGTPPDLIAEAGGQARPYSAWPSILPTRWSLLASNQNLGLGLGLALSGEDIVERHRWALELLGYASGPRFAAAAGYEYRGLGIPVVDIDLLQRWRVEAAGGSEGDGTASARPALLRQRRDASATLTWTRPRWRSSSFALVGLDVRDASFEWGDGGFTQAASEPALPLDLGTVLAAGFSTVRRYDLSLAGAQDGVLGSLQLEGRRYLDAPATEAANRNYWRAIVRTGGYRGVDWFGFAPPVFALRADAGVESDAAAPGFGLGGPGVGEGAASNLDRLRRSLTLPVRGYPAGSQRGSRVARISAEFRYPILLAERGFRLLPLALDRIWGDVFIDAGAAWCPAPCSASVGNSPPTPDPLLALGAEAIFDLRLGYAANLPLRFGVALPLREPGRYAVQGYVRVGQAF